MALWDTIFDVGLTALVAMGRIALLCLVGYACALFPRGAPLLPPPTVKILSRISNTLLLPSLSIVALGKGLTAALFSRMSVIIPFCFMNEIIAYGISYSLGWAMHEDNPRLYTAISVAIASPNVVSFPLMVMDTLCKQSSQIQEDFVDAEECFVEATSMIFVYSIGWQIVFWGYGFPRLQTLLEPEGADGAATATDEKKYDGGESASATEKRADHSSARKLWSNVKVLTYRLCSSPVLQATAIGIIVGVSSPIQNALFEDFTGLTPVGSTLETLADPVICMNCLIMSSSLASVTIFPKSESEEESAEVDVSTLGYVARARYELSEAFKKICFVLKGGEKSATTDPSQDEMVDKEQLQDTNIKTGPGTGMDTNEELKEYFGGYSTEGVSISDDDCGMYGDGTAKGGVYGRLRSNTEPTLSPRSSEFRVVNGNGEGQRDVVAGVFRGSMADFQSPSTSSSTCSGRVSGSVANSSGNDSLAVTNSEATKEMESKPIPAPEMRTVAAMLLCRLIISPLIVLPIAQAMMNYGWVAKADRPFMLIVILESAAPSAQLMIVALSQLGIVAEASQLAYCYIFQYTAACITVTVVTVAAIVMLYD